MKNKFILLLALFTNIFSCPHWYDFGCCKIVQDIVTVFSQPKVYDPIVGFLTAGASYYVPAIMEKVDHITNCAPGDFICLSKDLNPGTTGSAAVNNITSITPPATPAVAPQDCSYAASGPNPFFASNSTACQSPAPVCCYEKIKPAGCTGCTMDCLLASANSALAADFLPILGLTVVGQPIGQICPVEVDVFLNAGSGNYTSSVLSNSACGVSGNGCQCPNSSGPFNAGNMSGLLTGNSCGTLAPFYKYISNCLHEGKTYPAGQYGTEYNYKVFFNNANATFNGQSVNPIQCMKCTPGTVLSCEVVHNNSYNPYPACATQTTAIAPSRPPQDYGPEMLP